MVEATEAMDAGFAPLVAAITASWPRAFSCDDAISLLRARNAKSVPPLAVATTRGWEEWHLRRRMHERKLVAIINDFTQDERRGFDMKLLNLH